MTATVEDRVMDALTNVLDPCSCFTDDPVDIVDMGIVENVRAEDGTVEVELLLTSPGCTYLPYIERDVDETVRGVEGVREVEVIQITDQIWTEERMNDEVHERRRANLRRRLEAADVTPYVERVN
jgi:metal-sulfur cluster biosynthetic enzyme